MPTVTKGTVKDKATGAAIGHATVSLVDRVKKTIDQQFTDGEGVYMLSASVQDTGMLEVRADGYETAKIYVLPDGTARDQVHAGPDGQPANLGSADVLALVLDPKD